jgi:thiol-disulfide isomerase/thioredoxin
MNTNKFYIFVADWCPFCRAAKKDIFQLMDNYKSNKNIVLFEESMDGVKDKAIALGAFGYPHFVIVDENEKEVVKYPDALPGEMPDRSYKALAKFYFNNTQSLPNEEDAVWFSNNG